MKQIYRIEIPSKFDEYTKFFFWIGKDLELVSHRKDAIEVSEDESLFVMDRLPAGTVCFRD